MRGRRGACTRDCPARGSLLVPARWSGFAGRAFESRRTAGEPSDAANPCLAAAGSGACPSYVSGSSRDGFRARTTGVAKLDLDADSGRCQRAFPGSVVDGLVFRRAARECSRGAGGTDRQRVGHKHRHPCRRRPKPEPDAGCAILEDRPRITVTDPGLGHVPELRGPDDQSRGGLGLRIVDKLSSEWGVTRDSAGRTSVWCDLLLDVAPADTGIRSLD